ncbi:TPA: hypothetical protein QHB43_001676, partial [Aeromonas hydrophila subsp. hydrophila]|nr:hypothetical protein [Aeromonas hydrophila subsp. hydrophila]
AAIGVPLLIWIVKLAWGTLTTTRDRVETLEKEKARLDNVIETLKDDVNAFSVDLKATQTQQVRHDEQIKAVNNTMDEIKSDLKDLNAKMDILIQRK